MKGWFKTAWSAVRDSLWFLPAVVTIAAAALAFGLVAAEQHGLLWSGSPPGWVYQGGGDAARTVLSAVTGSLITVTGVIFAVTIVAVQLASSQYTPRVLRNFTSDRGNQIVLGVFIATFTYTILVLRAVHTDGSEDAGVPRFAITVAVALMIICVVALIYFINHVAREIHVTAILDRVTKQTKANVHKMFPEHIGEADPSESTDPRLPDSDAVIVEAGEAGYIQIVDDDALFRIGGERDLIVGMVPKIGAYVLQGRPLAAVYSPSGAHLRMDDALKAEIREAFVLGSERAPEQDVEFGIIQMSDIAIKALSPSINDPTTAMRCIDRLAEILAELGTREPPQPRRTREGAIHFVASYTTFDEGVRTALDGIRHFAAAVPMVAEHLLTTLGELETLLPEGRRQPIRQLAEALFAASREEARTARDAAALERSAAFLKQ